LRPLDALYVALEAMNDARTIVTLNPAFERAAVGFGIATSPDLPSDA